MLDNSKKLIFVSILLFLSFSFTAAAQPAPNSPPAKQQLTQSNIDTPTFNQLKAELARDFYKESVSNFKWALGILVTLVVAFTGVITGYMIFKNKREYKEALEDVKEALKDAREARQEAKEASEKARAWEQKAHERFDNIDAKFKSKMKEMEDKNKELIQEQLKEDEQRRKDARKEAEDQRKISELFNDGLRAVRQEDYQSAADFFEQVTAIEPDDYIAYTNWGTTLYYLAKQKQDKEADDLFTLACEKFEKATKIKPGKDEAYYNWGIALSSWANQKEGKEADCLFTRACEKFEKATEIKPDKYEAYVNWGITLSHWAKQKEGDQKKKLLEEAKEKLSKAEEFKSGAGAYNLGCLFALLEDEDNCRKWLKVGEKAGTLITRQEAMKDSDLKNVCDKSWFEQIRWKGE